jgi:hypothetical protein
VVLVALVVLTETLKTAALTVTELVTSLQGMGARRLRVVLTLVTVGCWWCEHASVAI